MIDPSEVSVVIPTRGDVDLTEIRASLDGFAEVIIWDNSARGSHDYQVYARYHAIQQARCDVIYTQDDDCIVDAARVCRSYLSGILTSNMPAVRWSDYPDSALVGWGAVFDRHLPRLAFDRWSAHDFDRASEEWLISDAPPAWFNRTCDVAFSTITPHQKIDIGFSHLPWAEGPGRMFTDDYPAHRAERDRMLELARMVRG